MDGILRGYTGYGDTQGFDSVRVLVLEMWLLVDVWLLELGTGLMGNGEGPGFGRDLRGDTGYGDTQGFDSVRVLVLKI